jgi:hypothetical protein
MAHRTTRESPATPTRNRHDMADKRSDDSPASPPATGTKRQARGLLAVATQLNRVTAAVRRKRGLSEAGLIAGWAAIVGDSLAAECAPQRLARGPDGTGGTLHVRVTGPLALELQHLEPLVIERINGYFGYRAVARLTLHQGPLDRRPRPRKPVPPAPDADSAARLEAQLAGVEDEALRAALARFGRGVLARRPTREENAGE